MSHSTFRNQTVKGGYQLITNLFLAGVTGAWVFYQYNRGRGKIDSAALQQAHEEIARKHLAVNNFDYNYHPHEDTHENWAKRADKPDPEDGGLQIQLKQLKRLSLFDRIAKGTATAEDRSAIDEVAEDEPLTSVEARIVELYDAWVENKEGSAIQYIGSRLYERV